jgi:hypothetical protein
MIWHSIPTLQGVGKTEREGRAVFIVISHLVKSLASPVHDCRVQLVDRLSTEVKHCVHLRLVSSPRRKFQRLRGVGTVGAHMLGEKPGMGAGGPRHLANRQQQHKNFENFQEAHHPL